VSWTRRDWLRTTALAAGGLTLPTALRAQDPSDRLVLVVLCTGGWDPSVALDPLFEHPQVDTDPGSAAAQAGDLAFVDHPDRPSVRGFFEAAWDQSVLIHGLEVPSITHDKCRQLLLTGVSGDGGQDWATRLAVAGHSELLLPHLVVSGPAFTGDQGAEVVRVGSAGQLPELLDGTALARLASPIPLPSDTASAAVDAWLAERANAAVAGAAPGRAARFADGYQTALADVARAQAWRGALRVTTGDDLGQQLALALDCFELGLSRCATVEFEGLWGLSWDTHAVNSVQGLNFEELFRNLSGLLVELDARGLSERVSVAVISEMGRHPHLNEQGGKHHWPVTSALLFGAGMAGGQVVGALDDQALGQPVDLATGELDPDGTRLGPAQLGATLLALGDVDPGEVGEPLTAVLA